MQEHLHPPHVEKEIWMNRILVVLVAFVACAVVLPATASADYGTGAYRQIEAVRQRPRPAGRWGVGAGAASDKGDLTWQQVGSNLVISGVVLNGLPTDPSIGDFSPFHTTITVPMKTGHYAAAGVGAYLTLPSFIPAGAGFSQLQVAP
jgi:hypothetical protein